MNQLLNLLENIKQFVINNINKPIKISLLNNVCSIYKKARDKISCIIKIN